MTRRFRAFETDALSRGARTKRQVIVAVSANNSADTLSDDGFDFVCSKPLSRTELYSILYQYLGDAQGV
jgi:BarA-like signal transduction histidine kinase